MQLTAQQNTDQTKFKSAFFDVEADLTWNCMETDLYKNSSLQQLNIKI